MLPIVNETFLLKKLLNKFVDVMFVREEELEWMRNYIFSDNSGKVPTTDDSEMYESLMYLQDLAHENNYKSVKELLDYFENQKIELNKLVEPLLSESENDLQGSLICRVFNASFKTEAIKKLTGSTQIYPSSPSYVVDSLYENVNNKICIADAKGLYKEVNSTAHCLNSINLFRNRSHKTRFFSGNNQYYFEHYFESLSRSANACEKIVFALRRVKNWFRNFQLSRKQKKKIKSLYAEIYEHIQTDQPIESDGLKIKLSKMMLMFKLNNPELKKYIHQDRPGINQTDFIAKKLYYQHLSRKKWSILKSPGDKGWITSDNPGFSIDIDLLFSGSDQFHADPYWLDIDTNAMIYFPLSKEYCLRLDPIIQSNCVQSSVEDNIIFFEISSEKEVEVVNKLVVGTKPNIILSEEKGIQKLQCY